MIEAEKIQLSKVALLFNGVEDSMVKSFLQGYMGSAFVQSMNHPEAVIIPGKKFKIEP